jgi:hypothetical protein
MMTSIPIYKYRYICTEFMTTSIPKYIDMYGIYDDIHT